MALGPVVRAFRACQPAKLHACFMLIERAAGALSGTPAALRPSTGVELGQDMDATKIREFVWVELDDIKERAFQSAFVQPTRLLFEALDDAHEERWNDLEIHGISVYLALLLSTLGVVLPRTYQMMLGDKAKGHRAFLDVGPSFTNLLAEFWERSLNND